jgi:hypothetical protein
VVREKNNMTDLVRTIEGQGTGVPAGTNELLKDLGAIGPAGETVHAPVVAIGSMTAANGADVTQGAIADAAVDTDTTGTVSGKLRGLVKLLVNLLSRLPAALAAGGGLKVEGVAGGVPLNVIDKRSPAAVVAHRTITALWGQQPPLSTDANWSVNPGGATKARFFTNLVVRGCTALADDPIVTFRAYVRNGTDVGRSADVTVTRSRLKDLNTIKFMHTHDAGANWTNDSAAVIDNSASTQSDLDGLDTLANLDYFVIGGPVPFMGVALDMDAANVNANAATLLVEYWNGSAWVAVTNMTDGTILVATKTLSGDGQISWDLPADWAASTLNALPAYWVRCSVSAALSANVDVEECDLLMPVKAAVDVQADGDDALLTLVSQDASVTGTLAYSGTMRLSWR